MKKSNEIFTFIIVAIVCVWAVSLGSNYLAISHAEQESSAQNDAMRRITSRYQPDQRYCRKDFSMTDCVSVWAMSDSDARLVMKHDRGAGYIIFTQKLEGNFTNAWVSLSSEDHWAEYILDANGKTTGLQLDGTRFYLQ